MNHEVVCGDNREIFVTIIEGSLAFDLIFTSTLKQNCVKFEVAPKLQITSNNIDFSFSL